MADGKTRTTRAGALFDVLAFLSYGVYIVYAKAMTKTSVVSCRLTPDQESRLERKARKLGRTPSETSALLIDEGLRRDEFAFVDFRDSPIGRLACLQGSTLAVWEIITLVREFDGDNIETAKHLGWSPVRIQAAVNYAKAFPGEIDAAIRENELNDFEAITRMLPQAVRAPHGRKE